MRFLCVILAVSTIAVLIGGRSGPLPLEGRAAVKSAAGYGRAPLTFEANAGQTKRAVKFLARSGAATLFLTPQEAVLRLEAKPRVLLPRDPSIHARGSARPERKSDLKTPEGAVIRMRLLGANPAPRVTGERKLSGVSNYLIGNDPKKWRTNVPHYARVRHEAVYPGIDLVYYGSGESLEYDFIVAPGADPGLIRKSFAGCYQGLDLKTGDLVLDAGGWKIREKRPVAYQEIDGRRTLVEASWELTDGQWADGASGVAEHSERVDAPSPIASFRLGSYDRSRPLVIDPVLAYSTYLGGSAEDYGMGMAVDSARSAYVTGYTLSTNFPITAGRYQADQGEIDAFVTKLSPAGNSLVYSTYLGGESYDQANGIAVDGDGSAYVTGVTVSSFFPLVDAFQGMQGGIDAFVTKLSPAGNSLIYSTYLGGGQDDFARGIALDGAENAYVTGYTLSINFPTVNPYFFDLGGADAFVTKLSSAGFSLEYSTYLGGSSEDQANGIAVDGDGNAYVTGTTASSDFPTTGPDYQTVMGGSNDAFVTKLSPDISFLVYSTFLGGSGDDFGNGIALDGEGFAYVIGTTDSADYPLLDAFQTNQPGGDAFVSKLSSMGRSLEYSTYLGGDDTDFGAAIAVDTEGSAYVTGVTNSTNFPIAYAYQSNRPGADLFVTKLAPEGSSLDYSTYLGGEAYDEGAAIAVDAKGSAYVTGHAISTDFPTVNAYQTDQSKSDAIVTKLSLLTAPAGLSATPDSSSGIIVIWADMSVGESGFEIERRVGGGSFLFLSTLPAASTSHLDVGLVPNQSYSYRVRAFGSQGRSRWAGPAAATTLPEPPDAPSGLYATASAANRLVLRWTDNANDETGFILQRSINRTSWTQILDGASNTIAFNDNGLTAGATYYYRVRAYNSGGVSGWSESATGTVRPDVPTAPEGLRATALIATQLFLTWQDRSSTETGFRLERKLVGGTYGAAVSLGANVNAFVDKNLSPQTAYVYRLYAFNAAGDSASSGEFTATTLPSVPAAPSGLTATPLSNRVVALAWTDNSANETEFRLERRNGAAAYAQIAVIVANGTSFFDSAVAPSTTYTYRIRAANSGGTSAYSSQVNGATPAGVSEGVLRVRPTAIRFRGVSPGESAVEKLTVVNAGKERLKVVVGQLAPPFEVLGARTFTLKPREQKALKVRYLATVTSKGMATTMGVAGSGRKNPMVYVPVTAD